jgi:hypothetical protein
MNIGPCGIACATCRYYRRGMCAVLFCAVRLPEKSPIVTVIVPNFLAFSLSIIPSTAGSRWTLADKAWLQQITGH